MRTAVQGTPMVNWTEVEAIANSFLVLTSASAIGYAGLQLKHERQYRSVANLEKQLGFFQSEAFHGIAAAAGGGPPGRGWRVVAAMGAG